MLLGNTYTFPASYLDSLADGTYTFIFSTNDGYGRDGNSPRFNLNITDSFVPARDITGIDATTGARHYVLAGTVFPANATNKDIVWSVTSHTTATALITNNGAWLSTTGFGTVNLRATITNGARGGDYTQDFVIKVVSASWADSAPVTDTTTPAKYKTDGTFDDLVSVALNGNNLTITEQTPDKVLLSGYPGYDGTIGEATRGSIEVTLYPEFLATLPNGTYKLVVTLQADGEDAPYAMPETNVVVNRALAQPPTSQPTTPADQTIPQTGDGNMTGWLVAFIALALGSACILLWRKRQRKNTRDMVAE